LHLILKLSFSFYSLVEFQFEEQSLLFFCCCCFNCLFASSQSKMSVFSKILKDNRISHSAILLASSMVVIYWSTLKVIKLRNKKYIIYGNLFDTIFALFLYYSILRLSKKLKNQLSIKHLEKVSSIF